jgi:hypothetical protein
MSAVPSKTKAVVTVGYTNYVLDVDKALTLLELLAEAELYEDKWQKKEDGGTTYHIFDQEQDGIRQVKVLPNAFYNMAKLAGKPNKE